MSNGIEKIALPIVMLVIVGAFLIFIGSQIPISELAQPFKDVGSIAIGGAIFLIILIIIIVVIMIYSRAR